jgi:DNA polymerase gamma 1
VAFLCCDRLIVWARYHLSQDGEWLVNEMDIEVEREEDGSVSLEELRRISKLAAQR